MATFSFNLFLKSHIEINWSAFFETEASSKTRPLLIGFFLITDNNESKS